MVSEVEKTGVSWYRRGSPHINPVGIVKPEQNKCVRCDSSAESHEVRRGLRPRGMMVAVLVDGMNDFTSVVV